MGRPAHAPTKESRERVSLLAGFGVTEEEISKVVGVSVPTLLKHYRHELDTGHTLATEKVAQSLYQKALGDGKGAVSAAIFWMKTRAKWKETSVHEHSGPDGQPIEQIERVIVRGTEAED